MNRGSNTNGATRKGKPTPGLHLLCHSFLCSIYYLKLITLLKAVSFGPAHTVLRLSEYPGPVCHVYLFLLLHEIKQHSVTFWVCNAFSAAPQRYARFHLATISFHVCNQQHGCKDNSTALEVSAPCANVFSWTSFITPLETAFTLGVIQSNIGIRTKSIHRVSYIGHHQCHRSISHPVVLTVNVPHGIL